jgi:MFS family permease
MRDQAKPDREGDWQPASLYTLGFLTLIATFNYLDRSLLGLALPAIKQEMHVSDTVLGLVSGLAFVLFYSILGVPIAWAADRYSRRNIIAIGFAFWSVMTALSGLVANIQQFAIARFLMGAGEAAGLSPSTSMLADLFRAARRPLAMAIFGTASAISGIIFFPIVGWIGENHGWRWMFFVAGAPGVLLALLFVLTVPEPARGGRDGIDASAKASSLSETVRFLLGSPAYLLLVAGMTFMSASLYGTAAWAPTFLSRVHGMSLGEVASTIGPVRGVLGALGILAGGLLIDRLGRSSPRMRVRIPAIACFIAGPSEALFLLSDPTWLWMIGFASSSFFILVFQGPVFALAISLVRPPMRAVATAIMVFTSALLGQAFGPLIVGVLNDLMQPTLGNEAVRFSLLVGALTPLVAGATFWCVQSRIEADEQRADAAAD